MVQTGGNPAARWELWDGAPRVGAQKLMTAGATTLTKRTKRKGSSRPAGAALLAPDAASLETQTPSSVQPPTGAVAAASRRAARTGRRKLIVHLASSNRRADEIARAQSAFGPEIDTIVLPPWDCLPYDRASTSRDVMGRRMQVLRRLGAPVSAARIVVTSPEALVLGTPPQAVIEQSWLELRPGDRIDRAALQDVARRSGYVADDRVDEPGEIAILGAVIDVFPADARHPVRLMVGEDDEPVVSDDSTRARRLAEGALIRLTCGQRGIEAYRGHRWSASAHSLAAQ